MVGIVCVCGGGGGEGVEVGGGGGGGLKPVLHETSPFSDAAPNYKYMNGPHRGPLPHL